MAHILISVIDIDWSLTFAFTLVPATNHSPVSAGHEEKYAQSKEESRTLSLRIKMRKRRSKSRYSIRKSRLILEMDRDFPLENKTITGM